MVRKTVFTPGEYYHVYNRGVDKRIIFERDSDYHRFATLLYLCNGKNPVNFWLLRQLQGPTLQLETVVRGDPLIAIGAYCLMPNHFHVLIRETSENGITNFMRKLATAYTMYFNISRERSGALFQGRFKATHADSDEYLKYLFSYIHLNPVGSTHDSQDRSEKFLASYPYSSYPDYLGIKREFTSILTPSEFPDYFPNKQDLQECIREWIAYREGFPGQDHSL